jgi:hypothetical protein
LERNMSLVTAILALLAIPAKPVGNEDLAETRRADAMERDLRRALQELGDERASGVALQATINRLIEHNASLIRQRELIAAQRDDLMQHIAMMAANPSPPQAYDAAPPNPQGAQMQAQQALSGAQQGVYLGQYQNAPVGPLNQKTSDFDFLAAVRAHSHRLEWCNCVPARHDMLRPRNPPHAEI